MIAIQVSEIDDGINFTITDYVGHLKQMKDVDNGFWLGQPCVLSPFLVIQVAPILEIKNLMVGVTPYGLDWTYSNNSILIWVTSIRLSTLYRYLFLRRKRIGEKNFRIRLSVSSQRNRFYGREY